MTRVRIDPLARLEVLDAVDYYSQFSEELAFALADEFEHALDQLSQFPLSMPVVRANIRKRPLFRFHYTVFYRATESEVYVIAFVHQRRGPTHLTARLSIETPSS